MDPDQIPDLIVDNNDDELDSDDMETLSDIMSTHSAYVPNDMNSLRYHVMDSINDLNKHIINQTVSLIKGILQMEKGIIQRMQILENNNKNLQERSIATTSLILAKVNTLYYYVQQRDEIYQSKIDRIENMLLDILNSKK